MKIKQARNFKVMNASVHHGKKLRVGWCKEEYVGYMMNFLVHVAVAVAVCP